MTSPGPEGGITWSGLTQGQLYFSIRISDRFAIVVTPTTDNPCYIQLGGAFVNYPNIPITFLPWGPMHVLPLGQ